MRAPACPGGGDAPAANPQATNHAVHPGGRDAPVRNHGPVGVHRRRGVSFHGEFIGHESPCLRENPAASASSTAGACRRGWWRLWRGDAPTAVDSAGSWSGTGASLRLAAIRGPRIMQSNRTAANPQATNHAVHLGSRDAQSVTTDLSGSTCRSAPDVFQFRPNISLSKEGLHVEKAGLRCHRVIRVVWCNRKRRGPERVVRARQQGIRRAAGDRPRRRLRALRRSAAAAVDVQ